MDGEADQVPPAIVDARCRIICSQADHRKRSIQRSRRRQAIREVGKRAWQQATLLIEVIEEGDVRKVIAEPQAAQAHRIKRRHRHHCASHANLERERDPARARQTTDHGAAEDRVTGGLLLFPRSIRRLRKNESGVTITMAIAKANRSPCDPYRVSTSSSPAVRKYCSR